MPDTLNDQQDQNEEALQDQDQQENQQAADTQDESQGGGEQVFDQAYVTGLRSENASWRTKHHDEKAAREKAETDLQTLVQSLGKNLGFVKDETDPAKLLEQLTAERDQTAAERDADRAKLRDYDLRDAVRGAAKTHGGDADSILDSSKVKAKLDKLDHTADDYATQVDAIVSEAITANPKFKSGPVLPAASTGDTNQGTGEKAEQLTREQLAKMSPSARLKAAREGRVASLIGN